MVDDLLGGLGGAGQPVVGVLVQVLPVEAAGYRETDRAQLPDECVGARVGPGHELLHGEAETFEQLQFGGRGQFEGRDGAFLGPARIRVGQPL
jgi:hypothetical protein